MATTTTNLGLVKPGYNDAADIMDINNNMDTLDEAVEKLREGIAIIVDGDTASVAVPAGGYAYIKNNTHGLVEGMYKNKSSNPFPVAGGTANSTVFTAAQNGAINDAVTSLSSKIAKATYTDGGNPVVLTIRKFGSICVLTYNNTTISLASGWRTLSGLIPNDYKPAGDVAFPCFCGASRDIPCIMNVKSNGDIEFYNTSSSNQSGVFAATATYVC